MAKPRDFEAFRPGKKYAFILEDLRRFTNKSARIREMYLLGMAVERGEYVKAADIPPSSFDVEELRKEWEKMQGSFVRPAPPVDMPEPEVVAYQRLDVVAPIGDEEEQDILANMLGGFD